ncbi:DUF726 domain-containing protein [Aliarcobacter cryaerophilus]|uniref:DUF726 domain-containing protein n=1 Tax=Aliarcobacter cryaerophilus TaxID=28198 RepID=UPI003DA4BEF3
MFSNLKKKAEEIAQKAKETVESKASKSSTFVSDTIKENIPNDILDNVSDIANKTKKVAQDNLESISDKLLDSGLEQIESYCSWCFEKHRCTLKEKNNLTRNIYICSGCGQEIVKCRVCNNKAKYSDLKNENVDMWSNNFCALHEGQIAKFESLNWSLESIGEYRDIVERIELNYKKIATTTAFAIGGVAVIAPVAFLAAPAIGGAVGTSLLGYSGAAATNAGLATLGGGALAAGGLGMTGGVAVVTATGSALGGRYGAVISNSYFGDIEGFEIVRIKQGIEPTIICIDGFLNEENKKVTQSWLDGLEDKYKENTIYYVKWESKNLKSLATFSSHILGTGNLKNTVISAALSASKEAAKKVSPLANAIQVLGLATNPWSVASVKAYQTGTLLADIIARTDKQHILIGHSLGARVIYSCLSSLKTKEKCFIKDVHLLGGAVDKNCKNEDNKVCWSELHNCVSGKIKNYFSKNDTILQTLYKVGEGVKFEFGDPIGRHPIENQNIDNIDVTEYVGGHTEYKSNLSKILRV